MKCPQCGLFHPSRYEQCVSCGTRLAQQPAAPAPAPADMRKSRGLPAAPQAAPSRGAPPPPQYADADAEDEEEEEEENESSDPSERRQQRRAQKKAGVSKIAITGLFAIVLICAGGTYCFLTKPPEWQVLLADGKQQLANGQFAFAQKTLERARLIKPQDPQILLTLARAYVGIDQVEKAWICITEAQQRGTGVMTDPQLSSDLANHYRQRNQYQRAADLLRPLAEQNLPKKRAELSDLLALWGDEAFRKGSNEIAVKCWEEVRTLKDGQRFSEAESRLASIYLKIANEKMAKGDEETALDFYNKLNNLAPSPQTYERTSDIYARQGKLDLSIDQLRRALKAGTGSIELNKKLAGLLAKRGRELLDKGDSDTGYAYLQQAQGYDNKIRVPTLALRNISVKYDAASGAVHVSGVVWNPGGNQINYLAIRADLLDTKTSLVMWRRDQHVVDEFMPPMGGHETRPFEVSGPCPRADGSIELKVYIDNTYYASYQIKEDGVAARSVDTPPRETPREAPPAARPATTPAQPPAQAPPPGPAPAEPVRQPVPQPTVQPQPEQQPTVSPEERTLQDLD